MGRMKVLASIALCLAACVPAQAAERVVPGLSAGSQMPAGALTPQQALPPQQAAKPSFSTRPEPKPSAAVAVHFTDDADSLRLPAFATRTTPIPTRLLRLGVEWSF